MNKTVGIIFADDMEYAPFEEYAEKINAVKSMRRGNESLEYTIKEGGNELKVIAVKSDMGKVNAAFATGMLIADDKVDFILNAGLSGAISGCKREDLVVGTSYIECDFDLTPIGYKPAEKCKGKPYLYEADSKLQELALMSIGLNKCKLGTGDFFLTDNERKTLYKNTFGINAFDMETGAIAAVCNKCNIPFLSVRKISDDADDDAMTEYREMNNKQESCLTEVLCNILSRMVKDNQIFAK